MTRDESLSKSLMVLCFVAAGALLSTWWQTPDTMPRKAPQKASPALTVSSQQVKPQLTTNSRLVVDLSDRLVYLYRADQLLFRYPVAVGQPGWQTPTGSFKVLQTLRNPRWRQPITGEIVPPGPDNPLGKRWIGFWSDGRNQIGFHGTNSEELVGQAVSHGCLRMRNQDIQAMYEQVTIGTQVIVRQ
ncbi:MAG TPA: L,D-transpeptidase [Candidatus Obscuribacterales bacterium]